eukprot:1084331-Heterocapsa_arctica.AAC.1
MRSGEAVNPGGLLNGDGAWTLLSLAPFACPKDLLGGTAPVASPPPGMVLVIGLISLTRTNGVGP